MAQALLRAGDVRGLLVLVDARAQRRVRHAALARMLRLWLRRTHGRRGLGRAGRCSRLGRWLDGACGRLPLAVGGCGVSRRLLGGLVLLQLLGLAEKGRKRPFAHRCSLRVCH